MAKRSFFNIVDYGTSNIRVSIYNSELIEKLGQRLKVIGVAWNNNVKQIGSNLN